MVLASLVAAVQAGCGRAGPAEPQRQHDVAGVHNVIRVSDRIYSGSEPEGERGLASLARLGIKTVVSVDGARPQVEAARELGLRYIHVPIGYDGIDPQAALALARAARECEGPLYIHCHHGQHRGPAAAAVAAMAADGRTAATAKKVLETAGTSRQYAGLWRDVERFVPPPQGAALPELVETAEVGSLAAAMAALDRNFDNLKLCRGSAWSAPPDHPDLAAASEALMLKETLRETVRNLVEEREGQFRAWLDEAALLGEQLETAVRRGNGVQASRLMEAMERSCSQCHQRYRN